MGLYSVRGGNGNSIVRSDCGRGHGDPRRPKEDHGKLIFFRLLPHSFSSIYFLLLSPFSANERRNSGIIGLYVSPPRQYTRSHTFLRKEPIPASLRYRYVTESHLSARRNQSYIVIQFLSLGKAPVLFSISRLARINRNDTGCRRVDRG